MTRPLVANDLNSDSTPARGQMWCRMARLSPPGLGFTKSAEDRGENSKDAARSRKTIVGLGLLHFSCTAMIAINSWEETVRKTDVGIML